jgi:hypothetical protein
MGGHYNHMWKAHHKKRVYLSQSKLPVLDIAHKFFESENNEDYITHKSDKLSL